MTKQPLHEVANDLHGCFIKLTNAQVYLDQGKVITAYKTMSEVLKTIEKMQVKIREKAIKDEGAYFE